MNNVNGLKKEWLKLCDMEHNAYLRWESLHKAWTELFFTVLVMHKEGATTNEIKTAYKRMDKLERLVIKASARYNKIAEIADHMEDVIRFYEPNWNL